MLVQENNQALLNSQSRAIAARKQKKKIDQTLVSHPNASEVLRLQLDLSSSNIEEASKREAVFNLAKSTLLDKHWAEIAYERNLSNICGYPLCTLQTNSPEFQSVLTHQATLDPLLLPLPTHNVPVTMFCSHVCRLRTKILYVTAANTAAVRAATKKTMITTTAQSVSPPTILSTAVEGKSRRNRALTVEGYTPRPSLFSLLVLLFQRLITPATHAYVRRSTAAADHPLQGSVEPCAELLPLPVSFVDVGSVGVEFFFERLRRITFRMAPFLPTVDAAVLAAHVDDMAKTFHRVEKAMLLVLSEHLYSWMFVLVCLWGASRACPDLHAALFDAHEAADGTSVATRLVSRVLLPVAHRTGVAMNPSDTVARIGEHVFLL